MDVLETNIAGIKRWLELARQHQHRNSVDHEVECVREHIAKAVVSLLENIGTSEEDLEELLRNGWIAESKRWLAFARERQHGNDVNHEVERVRRYASKAGVTLEYVGTSEEDLAEMLENGRKAKAKAQPR